LVQVVLQINRTLIALQNVHQLEWRLHLVGLSEWCLRIIDKLKLTKEEKMLKKIVFIALFSICSNTFGGSFHTDDVLQKNVPILMEKYKVPGVAIGILEQGTVSKYYFFGYSDVSLKEKMTKDTGFNVGSISKSVTAWGVMKLVEQGKIDLDVPVQKYITRWSIPHSLYDSTGVTVRRLLNHTSGLSQHAVPQFELSESVPSLEKSLSNSVNHDGEKVMLVSEPRTNWSYSGGGYTLLQMLVEEITGESFAVYMSKEILHPLGMLNSSFEPNEKMLSNLATSYGHDGKETARLQFAATGAAGLQSTPNDLAKFANAALTLGDGIIAGRGVLKPETVSQMVSISSSAKLPDGSLAHRNYSLGYFISTLSPVFYGHGGDNRGWHSRFIVYPETSNGLVILTNSSNAFYMAETINCLLSKELTKDNEANCV
jgi:CubicO group peptidase (beta-lactamase class C family)